MTSIVIALLRAYGLYVLSAIVGFMCAWTIQESNIEEAHNEMSAYVLSIGKQKADEATRIAKLNEDTTNDWLNNLNALHDHYRRNPVVRLLPARSPMPSGGVSGCAIPTYEAAPNAESGALGVTAEDCAVTTLQLLQLQAWSLSVAK